MDNQGPQPYSPLSPTGTLNLRCHICRKLFSRREHLDRHGRSHTKEKPFPCPTCRKSFSRADSLRRHQESHLQDDDTEAIHPSRGSTRACNPCAASRVRCQRGDPCRRCSLKNLPCHYPSNNNNTKKTPRESLTADITTGDDGAGLQEVRASPLEGGHGFGHDISATTGKNSLENTQAAINEFPSVREFSVNQQLPQYGYDPMCGPNFDHQALLQLNWLTPPTHNSSDWDFLAQIPASFTDVDPGPTNFPLVGAVEPTEESMLFAPPTGEPTVEDCMQVSPGSNRTSFSRASSSTKTTTTCNLPGRTCATSSPASSTGTYYVDGTGARAPFQGRRVTNRGSRVLVASHASDETRSDMTYQNCRTPSSALSSEGISIYHRLIEGLSLDGLDTATCPPPAYVDTCIRLYFERFHVIFPFIRREELGNGKQPWLLLLAIAATGARYIQDPGLDFFRDTLFDSLHHQALNLEIYDSFLGLPECGWNPSSSSTRARSTDEQLPRLQAGILHVLILLHSGKQSLVKRAISARYYLVEACHRLQLLGSPDTVSNSVGCENDDIESWIIQQSRLRVGFMIFIVDFMFAYELNLKSLMQLSDAKGLLPCEGEAWETPSAENIASARCTAVTLQEALEMLYMEKRLPPRPADFATTVLIHAVVRQAGEAAHQSPLWSWTPSSAVQIRPNSPRAEKARPTSFATTVTSKWRNCACDCLDIIHWRANSKAAGCAGWEDPTILQLHLARFILLTPVAQIKALAAKCISAEAVDPETDHRLAVARNQVLQWAIHDQYKARLCLVHAGGLFWHVRRYSLDSIVEPFSIYLAVLVVWAYAVSMQSLRPHEMPRPRPEAVQETRADIPGAVTTDVLAPIVADTTIQVSSEEEEQAEGVPEPSFIHLDRPVDDELVQTYVRHGDKMSGYMLHIGNINDRGAPKKILQEGIRLLLGAGQGVPSAANRGGVPGHKEPQYIWGVEGEYIELLTKLAQVTI